MNLAEYFDFTTRIAYEAGRITLGYFDTGLQADYKQDLTPVTAADRAAEEFIRSQIEKTYPRDAIVGEEFGESSHPGNPNRWIIDPIDGTKSFVRGVPLYAVLIGLEIEGRIKVGSVYFPVLDMMLSAAEGTGAWCNGRRVHVSQVDRLDQACICYTSVQHLIDRNPGIWNQLSRSVYMTRGWSDAYGFFAVATGRAEACLDPEMKIWDCGPFPVILREAGGFFGSWKGAEGHMYGEALACSQLLKQKLLDLLRE